MAEDFETDALVISERQIGEADKLITLLSAEHGKITVNAKGAMSLKSRYSSSTQLFSYSTYLLRRRGNYCYIRDAQINECFLGLRNDIERLSLANYICDVTASFAQEEYHSEPELRITLNMLHALANRPDIPAEQIKAAFEMRIAGIEGYAPDTSRCGICGAGLEEKRSLNPVDGMFLCKKCRTPDYPSVSDAVFDAVNYLLTAPLPRLLSFKLDENELASLSALTECYLLNRVEHGYSSLEYYKKMKV